ncbi:Uncharacterised protein [Candidatus Norongarragalina meridionalis]|nr:Uncharacterised protein [Candidatus Norongarragalina meridionalis]
MVKTSLFLLLVAFAYAAFAADAKVVFSKDVSPNGGAGFDSVYSTVTLSLASEITAGMKNANVGQASILVKGGKFDDGCFVVPPLEEVKDASGKVIDKKLGIKYRLWCQRCDSDNRIQVALTTQLDKVIEFGFKINCAADTVFVSNGELPTNVKQSIVNYGAKMKPERIKYVNVQNAGALADGETKPFATAIDYYSGEAIRDSRISYIKQKIMADSKGKTLIIIGNPTPGKARFDRMTATEKEGYFPQIRKKIATSPSGDVSAWELDVPIDRLYDADFGGALDTGSFASGDYLVVSRIPGYPNDAALSSAVIENFLKNVKNGAPTVSGEPLVVADSSGGNGDFIRDVAEAEAPRILPNGGVSSSKFMFAPTACKTAEKDGSVCNYATFKTAFESADNFMAITHGNGRELIAQKGDVSYTVLSVSIKTDASASPTLVSGLNCFGSAIDCAIGASSGCLDLTPSATSDYSLVRALMSKGTALILGYSRTSLYDSLWTGLNGKTIVAMPNPVLETLLYARDHGVTVGEAFNKVDLDYLKAKLGGCKTKLMGTGNFAEKSVKDIDNFCDPSKQESHMKWNLYGVNLMGIPKVKVA